MPAQIDSTVVLLDHRSARPTAPVVRRSTSLIRPIWGVASSVLVLSLLTWNAAAGGGLFRGLASGLFETGMSEEGEGSSAAPAANLASTRESSPFQLLGSEPNVPARLPVAAVVLNVENRPVDQQDEPSRNPASQAPATPLLLPAAGPAKVPMLTPSQAEQVFDPLPAKPLLPARLVSQRIIPGIPWVYLPIEPEGSLPSSGQDPAAVNSELDLPAQLDTESQPSPRSVESTREQLAADSVAAPLVPLEHPEWSESELESYEEANEPALASGADTTIRLAPSDEITPLVQPEKRAVTPPPAGVRPELGKEPQPLRPILPVATDSQPKGAITSPGKSEKVVEKTPLAPWPRPEYLLNRVAGAAIVPGLESWVERTTELLGDLHTLPTLADPQAVSILGELERQTAALEPLVIRFSTVPTNNADEALGPESLELRRIAYKLRQQIDVWYATHELAVRNLTSLGDFEPETIVKGIQVSRARLSFPGVSPEWQRYLVLEQVDTAFNSLQSSPAERQAAARRFLARLHSPILNRDQQAFLASQINPELVEQLKVAAREDIRLEDLLKEVEALQENRNGVAQHRVNQLFQNLAWHDDPAARELAATLDTHFRNANFRVSVSAEMLNLLLPDIGETEEPVYENVMGAEVRGQSRVANRLQIRLIPDTSRIQMRLEAIGKVLSQTEAQRSGFTIQNVGDARFQVFKRLAIGREGIITDQPEAWSRATNRMVGMQSELDGVPVLGWVARRIAERKIAEQSPQVEQYTRSKLETTIKHRFDSQIEEQLSEMQQYLSNNMIQPLTALELEPTPLEMRSTDQRVIMRYRLAGFDQMGGNTARPRGLQNSLLSMQIHETSINNLLNRIDLNGQEFTADELTCHLANVFGWQADGAPQSREATFEFAPFDPIRVTFSHGSAAVQLNLKRLRIGNGKTWKNLTATCNFIPQTDGGKIVFVQDGSGVALSGYRLGLRDQVAVRAIFTALFKDQYELPILPKNIVQKLGPSATITQLELDDGWIGLSVDKQENLTPQRISELEGPRVGGR